MSFLQYGTYCSEGKISYDILLNFFSQNAVLSVRLYLINTNRCRHPPGGVREPNQSLDRLPPFFRPRVRAQKPNSLALQAAVREPCRRPGSIFLVSRHRVRAQKPNSLALPGGVREPCRRPGSIFLVSRHRVRARKPNSLALRAAVREPCWRPGSIFLVSRHRVRAQKPNSLALQAAVREPWRHEIKTCIRKAISRLHDEHEHARLGQTGWHERRIRDVSPGGSLIACSSRLIVKLLLAGAGLLFF